MLYDWYSLHSNISTRRLARVMLTQITNSIRSKNEDAIPDQMSEREKTTEWQQISSLAKYSQRFNLVASLESKGWRKIRLFLCRWWALVCVSTRVRDSNSIIFYLFLQLNVRLSFTQFLAIPLLAHVTSVSISFTRICECKGHAFLLIFLVSFTFSLIIELSIVSLHLYKQFKGNPLSTMEIPRRLYYKRWRNANVQLVINIDYSIILQKNSARWAYCLEYWMKMNK